MLRKKCSWKAELQKDSSVKALSGRQNHEAKLHIKTIKIAGGKCQPLGGMEGGRQEEPQTAALTNTAYQCCDKHNLSISPDNYGTRKNLAGSSFFYRASPAQEGLA